MLYEDEFGDKGYTMANVRFRVMEDCFFVLLRSYVRIDSVIVRILDTRLYHDFSTYRLLRDFSKMECTFEELMEKGYTF